MTFQENNSANAIADAVAVICSLPNAKVKAKISSRCCHGIYAPFCFFKFQRKKDVEGRDNSALVSPRTSVLLPSKPALLPALLIERPRRTLRTPSLLRPSLLSPLNIPPTRTAAALSERNQESQNRSHSRYPHKRKHLRTNAPLNIQLLDGGDGVLHDDEHHGCDDRGHGGEQRGEESEDRDEQADPAGVDCDQLHGDHDEGEAGAGEEEGEHPVGDEAD